GMARSAIDPGAPLARHGLDSLGAIELAHALELRAGAPVAMESFFDGTSLDQLLAEVSRPAAATAPAPVAKPGAPATAVPAAADEPLSWGQRALWLLHQLDPLSAAYHVANAVIVEGELDRSALRGAFQALVARPPALRSAFVARKGEPAVRVQSADEAVVDFRETSARRWSEQELATRLCAEADRPFDLERGPLLRVHLFTRSKQDHVLL